jgi:predicted  nucleic acid-binding Zn-ribbon protein
MAGYLRKPAVFMLNLLIVSIMVKPNKSIRALEAKNKKLTKELRASKDRVNMLHGHTDGLKFEIGYLKDEIKELRDALSGAREIAFAMVTHPRLGQDTLLCQLEPRLIQRIVAMSYA